QNSLNAAAGGNLLEKCPQDALTIIENKLKVRNSRSKPIASPVNACDNHSSSELAKLTHAVNQQTSAVTTAMTAMLKQFQSNPMRVANQMRPPGFAQPNVQNNQNRFGQPQDFNRSPNFNQELPYQATQSNQNFHLNELEKIKRMNDGRELSRAIPIANSKGELKAITTRSGLVTEGPTIPNPPKPVNPEEDECVKEQYTDPDHAEYNIKVPPPPPVQKPKPQIQRNFVIHTRYSLPSRIPYPSRMLKQKQQEKVDIQIQKFWNTFKQLHLNITLAEALVLMPKYQKMLKVLLSNKRKLQELANTPLKDNCSAVILKKLPEKLGDPGKFLIPCRFSELKCKALADLGASINLMPLSVWRKLGLPDLIPTQMTLELANHAICTPDGIARDVFVPVASYSNHPYRESVNLINIFNLSSEDCLKDFVSNKQSGNPTFSLYKEIASPEAIPEFYDSKGSRALINVHGKEMILRDGDERLTLNMKHDTTSYSNHPRRESVNLINIFNLSSEDCLEDLVSNKQSGNPTFSLHNEIASSKVIHEFHDLKGCNFLSEELPDIDSFND
nr:reverse transcriptase domain-containing protein [Tanacetum cinerariifolium]